MQKRQYMTFAYIDKTACSMCEIDLGLSTLVLTKIKIKSCHVINQIVLRPTTLCHLFELVKLLILEDDHVLQTDQHTAALALLLSSKIQISFWWRKVGAGESIAWCNL